MGPISSTPDPARAVYVISVAAELAGVHAQTLRIYERKGLVEPAPNPGTDKRGLEFGRGKTCFRAGTSCSATRSRNARPPGLGDCHSDGDSSSISKGLGTSSTSGHPLA